MKNLLQKSIEKRNSEVKELNDEELKLISGGYEQAQLTYCAQTQEFFFD